MSVSSQFPHLSVSTFCVPLGLASVNNRIVSERGTKTTSALSPVVKINPFPSLIRRGLSKRPWSPPILNKSWPSIKIFINLSVAQLTILKRVGVFRGNVIHPSETPLVKRTLPTIPLICSEILSQASGEKAIST